MSFRNKPNKSNNTENQNTPEYSVKIIASSRILPPELIQQIERELGIKSQTVVEDGKRHKKEEKPKKKINYNFDMVSASMDLKNLVQKLKNSKIKSYSLLLYGEPGAGKTYLGNYLAQELGMEVVKKKASDMLSRFVGDSERLISAAFQEAIEKNAILILDECDSMLTDRSKAKQDFQVSSVNTMLSCMEEHPLPFICSTNLKQWLDKASMRRFIFKIKFDEMDYKNIQAGIKEYFGKTFKITAEEVKDLKHITAGDFPVVKKKIDILENGNYKKETILEYLREEQKQKEIVDNKQIAI